MSLLACPEANESGERVQERGCQCASRAAPLLEEPGSNAGGWSAAASVRHVTNEQPGTSSSDQLAQELGRIVVRAVWVDEVCADLAVEFQRASGAVDRTKVTGESGRPLGSALREAGAAVWADEYDELYMRRNDVIHGRWTAGPGYRQVVRPVRRGGYAGAFTVKSWDASWLDQLARDLDNFFERARTALFERRGIPMWLAAGRPYD